MRETFTRVIAAIAAAVGWGALLLQFWIILQQNEFLPGLWRFLGFFTILTNLLICLPRPSQRRLPSAAATQFHPRGQG
jgi:hypothetical protein